MSDAPNDRDRIEREALDVVLAYYAGEESLEAAARAIRLVSALPPPDDAEPQPDKEIDMSFGLDPASLPPEYRARFDALMRAIEVDPPATVQSQL